MASQSGGTGAAAPAAAAPPLSVGTKVRFARQGKNDLGQEAVITETRTTTDGTVEWCVHITYVGGWAPVDVWYTADHLTAYVPSRRSLRAARAAAGAAPAAALLAAAAGGGAPGPAAMAEDTGTGAGTTPAGEK